jgi:cell division transport system ATP-binding protein
MAEGSRHVVAAGAMRGRRRAGRALRWTAPGGPCHVLAAFAKHEDRAPLVLLEHVAVRYRDGPEILRDVSFALAPGSFHFLVGPSGAGKSTLLRLLYLALKPTEGRLSLFGRDVAALKRPDLPALRRRIGVVFQDFRLLDHLTAFDNVALPLRLAGLRETEIKKHVSELLDWVGLGDRLGFLPATLSGGQQQRVAIARAVIARPSLLLADEPTGNVDDRIAVRLMYLFEELHKLGTTVLIATHNEGLVGRFAHRQLRLEAGRLVAPRRAQALH